MNPAAMVRAYLQQSTLYYSASKDALILIADMDPNHAANAAERLVQDARIWAGDAGQSTRWPAVWMSLRPLVRALANQAGTVSMDMVTDMRDMNWG